MNLIKKFQKSSVTLKATVIFGISSFVTSGINYITTPIFTRLLSTGEYGLVSIYNSWLSIVQVFLTLTLIYPGVLNVGLYEHSDNRWRYLSVMQGIITTISAAFLLIYSVTWRSVNALIKLPTSLMILMLIYCMIHPAMVLWTTKQRYEYRYKITFYVTVGAALFAQIVSVAAVIFLKDGPANLAVVRLWSAGFVNLIVAMVIYLYIFRKGRVFYDSALWKATLIVTVPLIPHYLSHVVLNGTDKIMIGRMISESQAGIYSLAATLSSIGVLAWRALRITFSPFVNTKLGERKFSEINKAVKPLWLYVAGFCIIGALLSPEIIRILATKSYLEGVYVVPAIVASIYLHCLYDTISAVSFFHKKSLGIMTASVTAALVNIITNYFGIKYFGFIAAGYTTLFANIILVFMHYVISRKAEKEEIYDVRFLVLSVVIVTAACFTCNLLFGLTPFLRYFFALVVMALLIMKRRILIRTLSNMKV